MNVNNRYNFKDISMGRQKRTAFDISESKTFDCYPGSVIPAYVRYMNPGDTFKIKNRLVVRANPLISPAYVKMEAVAHTFFVPFRLLWDKWEDYITKGVSGDFTADIPRMFKPHNNTYFYKHSFYDYMGLPIPNFNFETGFNGTSYDIYNYFLVNTESMSTTDIPHNFPYSAYNFIFNEFYRDENLTNPRAYYMLGSSNGTRQQGEATNPIDSDNPFYKYDSFNTYNPVYSLDKINGVEPSDSLSPLYTTSIFQVTYKKDYFTSALPFQQRGDAPAIPITSNYILSDEGFISPNTQDLLSITLQGTNPKHVGTINFKDNNTPDIFISGNQTQMDALTSSVILGANSTTILSDRLKNNTSITSFSLSVPELYLLTSLQKWQQITARGGVRLNEFLLAMYGISPSDAVLQRPQYLGGLRSPIMISEVAQTSQTTDNSELGQLAGYGLSATENFIDSYTAREHGVLMTLFFITYQPNYPTAIDRELLNSSVYDWYFPTFTNLADQAILSREIYLSNDSTQNEMIFGYQGKYDELRTSFNKVAGSLRTNELGNWTASRRFTSTPALNTSFIQIKKDSLKDLFQVQDQPPFIVYFDTHCEAIRPLPYHSNPSLEV